MGLLIEIKRLTNSKQDNKTLGRKNPNFAPLRFLTITFNHNKRSAVGALTDNQKKMNEIRKMD